MAKFTKGERKLIEWAEEKFPQFLKRRRDKSLDDDY